MAKYNVTLYCEVAKTYEIESDSPENAMEQAYKMDKDVPISEYSFNGENGCIVQDEKGNIVAEE
jgi:hypothetical protein